MEITIYLVGYNEDDAKENWPFDSFDSAYSYAIDQSPEMNIYSVNAKILFDTLELERSATSR